jgi:hypothetical protein
VVNSTLPTFCTFLSLPALRGQGRQERQASVGHRSGADGCERVQLIGGVGSQVALRPLGLMGLRFDLQSRASFPCSPLDGLSHVYNASIGLAAAMVTRNRRNERRAQYIVV